MKDQQNDQKIDKFVGRWLSESEWAQICETASFKSEKKDLALSALDFAIGEFITAEQIPRELQAENKVLEKIRRDVNSLSANIKHWMSHPKIYQRLANNADGAIPLEFADNNTSSGHKRLTNLIKDLDQFGSQIETDIDEEKKGQTIKKRGPQTHNLKRLVLCISKIVAKCTVRSRLIKSPNRRSYGDQYSDNDLVESVCEIAVSGLEDCSVSWIPEIGKDQKVKVPIAKAIRDAIAADTLPIDEDVSGKVRTSELFDKILNERSKH